MNAPLGSLWLSCRGSILGLVSLVALTPSGALAQTRDPSVAPAREERPPATSSSATSSSTPSSDTPVRHLAVAEVAFVRGLVALHEGEIQEAIQDFEQAVAADPEHRHAPAYLDYARRLAAGESPPEPSREEPPFGDVPLWEVGLGFQAGSDSNPALLGADTIAVPFEGRPEQVVEGDESDTFTQLDLRAATHPVVDRGGWTLGLTGEIHQTLFGDLDFLDFTRARGVLHLSHGGDPLGYLTGSLGWVRVPFDDHRVTWLFQLGAASDRLDGTTWRDELSAAVSGTFRETRSLATRMSVSFRDHDFEQAFEAEAAENEVSLIPQDFSELGLAVDQWLFFGRRNRYLRLGVAASQWDSKPGASGVGLSQEASTRSFVAEVALPFSRRFTLWLQGTRLDVECDDVESNPLFPFFFPDRPREDTLTRLVAVGTWKLKPRLLLTGRVARVDRDTTLGPAAEELLDLDYERTVVSLGVRWLVLSRSQRGGERGRR